MRDTFSFVCRAAPSLVWTISITTVLKFNDSEPNELHLDKFAFVGFVPRNTVNLTREPRVMNYGEYELFARSFFDFASSLYIYPRPFATKVFQGFRGPRVGELVSLDILSRPLSTFDFRGTETWLSVRNEKTLSRDGSIGMFY